MINQELALKIIRTLSQYRPKRIAVFGSYVRGEQQPESDLDILIDFMDRKSLFDLVHIENELSNALGIKVDLVTENSLSPYLKPYIHNELQVIYG